MRAKRTLAVAVLLALAAVACSKGTNSTSGRNGDSGSVKAAAAIVAAASKKTVDAGTAKMSMSMTASKSPQEPIFSMTGTGLMDFKGQAGSITFSMTGEDLGPGMGNFEIRYLKNFMYMKFPVAMPGLEGRRWIRIDVEELAKETGVDLEQFKSFQNNDPAAALNYLQGVSDDVRVVGKADVRGVPTTQYAATVDLKKAMSLVGADEATEVQNAIDQFGVTALPVNAWIDEDGVLRKMTFTIELTEAGETGTMDFEMELFDFGTPVKVTAPPAGEITDLKEFLELAEA